MLYEDGVMQCFTHPVILNEVWISWLWLFFWENPQEEENDKNNKNEEIAKKWNHIQYNDTLFQWEHESYLIKIKYNTKPKDLTFEQ